MSVPSYQPHIDGLRAVAVLLVILHHLDWLGLLSGGYIGVDVFFVISGYLITSIIKSEIERGHFTLGGFYKRRVLRLAPAYFSVLLATTVASLFWMLPTELMVYARSAAASSVFLSNFYMWKHVGGYFGPNAETAPLLHLWSLAVEEQFYLFWPVALLLGYWMLGRRWMLWAIATVAIGGAVISQWGVERFPAAAYYLLPTRFFELAVGAVLAYLPGSTLKKSSRALLSLGGMALLAYAGLRYGEETPFPGYAAIAPVIGTALVLRWGAETPIGRLLSTAPFTLVGRISYPAYLWHWPIIAFLHIHDIVFSWTIAAVVLTATLALAWITWKWLELPARRFLSSTPQRVIAFGAGVPIVISVIASYSLVGMQGLPSRFPESLTKKSEAMASYPHRLRGLCNEGIPDSPLAPSECVLGRIDGSVDFLLVGDSHANHFSGFMDELGREAEVRGYDMTRSNAPFLSGVVLNIPDQPVYNRSFGIRNAYVANHLSENRYGAIVLGGAWANYYNRGVVRGDAMGNTSGFEQGFREAIRLASASADQVIVLTSIPQLPAMLYSCPLRRERFGRVLDCRMPVSRHLDDVAGVSMVFDRVRAEYPSVVWVDVDKLLCDEAFCTTEINGVPLYRNGGHLNDVGSRLLARRWIAKYGNPLEPLFSESESYSLH